MKASKLTARSLAYALRAVGRKVAKARREAQTPHGKQSVKKLMAHGAATSSIEVDAPKVFDRVARKYGIDYSLKKAEKEQAKEEDVLICARCGEQIIGDYDYVKTRRRTEMYFHKCLTCKAKEV